MLAKALQSDADGHEAALRSFTPVGDLLDELRNGRMVILYDHGADRGFLLGAAQMATPAMINSIALHGKGVICLALTRQRIEELGLPMMAGTPHHHDRQAFTVSIEARHGVSTGISAADRAKTIATAIYATDPAVEIVTPGHIFPLRAADGGVLERTGQAEAATDLARLAGMNPSGVICSIINDAGEDADLGDISRLAGRLDLKLGCIKDLFLFRQKQDRYIDCPTVTTFESRYGGTWELKVVTSDLDKSETIVLQKGEAGALRATPLVLLPASPLASLIAEAGGDNHLARAMGAISERGAGIIIASPSPDTASFLQPAKNGSHAQDYGKIAQILAALDVEAVQLLSRCDVTAARLKSVGVTVLH